MIVLLIMGVVSPLLLGYCLLRFLAPGTGVAVQLSLGAGIGAGLLSCGFFVSLQLGVPPLLPEALAIVAAVVFCLKQGRESSPPATLWTPITRTLGAVFVLTAAAALIAFLSTLISAPHGGSDGWVFWNTKARFLATPAWREIFSPYLLYSHPDYPLLLPGFIARIWRVTGGRELTAPAIAAGLFTFSTVGVLVSSLALLKGRAQGFLAGILLTGTHYFALHGASEYADVPVGFFLLATLAVFAIANHTVEGDTGASPSRLLILPGLTAGLAAWTKNEGWVLVLAIAAVCLFAVGNRATREKYSRPVFLAAAGLAPLFLLILYFKFAFATPNDFVGAQTIETLRIQTLNPIRYLVVLQGMLQLINAADTPKFLIPLLGVVVYAFFARSVKGGSNSARDGVKVRACTAVLAIVFIGYYATIVISPFQIGWQVGTTLDRLLLQLLPAMIFTVFLALPSVE